MSVTTTKLKIGGAIAAATLAAAWGASAAVGSGGSGALPESWGACPGFAEAIDPVGQLSAPGAWVRVNRIDLRNAPQEEFASASFAGDFTVAGGDESFVDALAAPTPLTFHVSTARAVGEALEFGADVVAHTGVDGNARHVAYAIALKDGDFAFLGACTFDVFTKPVRAQLRSADAVAALVGKTGAEVREALTPLAAATPKVKREVILHPHTAPRSLLSTLDEAMFSVAAPPEQWRGDYTLCTRIAQGWNDCVDLSSVATATIPVHMYYDSKNPTVEVWLLDHRANAEKPIARLGRVNVMTLAAQGKVDPAERGMRLGLTWSSAPGGPSLPDVVADHAKGPLAVGSLKVTPLD